MEKNKSTEASYKDGAPRPQEDAGAGNTETAPSQDRPPRGSKEEAYEWLYRHHVTVRIMDVVIAVCIILLVIVVILGIVK